MAHAHLSYYRAMEQAGEMKMIRNRGELTSHFAEYRTNPAQTPLGFILTMEGADPLLDARYGLRIPSGRPAGPGLTHYGCNRYGGGTQSEVGLAIDAIPLLKNCEQLGITIDMTHLSDVAFWQVAEHFSGRVHASHQNARAICDWQRQFSDDQIRLIIERDGVLGVSMDVIMLQNGFVADSQSPRRLWNERSIRRAR